MSYQVHLLRPLASGGNADVQLGQRSDTGAYVVVKYLREWHLDHARKGFAREVRILDQNLPGMIQVLFSDVKTERPYYVMPYLPADPLPNTPDGFRASSYLPSRTHRHARSQPFTRGASITATSSPTTF